MANQRDFDIEDMLDRAIRAQTFRSAAKEVFGHRYGQAAPTDRNGEIARLMERAYRAGIAIGQSSHDGKTALAAVKENRAPKLSYKELPARSLDMLQDFHRMLFTWDAPFPAGDHKIQHIQYVFMYKGFRGHKVAWSHFDDNHQTGKSDATLQILVRYELVTIIGESQVIAMLTAKGLEMIRTGVTSPVGLAASETAAIEHQGVVKAAAELVQERARRSATYRAQTAPEARPFSTTVR
jgi:hypothetical protein